MVRARLRAAPTRAKQRALFHVLDDDALACVVWFAAHGGDFGRRSNSRKWRVAALRLDAQRRRRLPGARPRPPHDGDAGVHDLLRQRASPPRSAPRRSARALGSAARSLATCRSACAVRGHVAGCFPDQQATVGRRVRRTGGSRQPPAQLRRDLDVAAVARSLTSGRALERARRARAAFASEALEAVELLRAAVVRRAMTPSTHAL